MAAAMSLEDAKRIYEHPDSEEQKLRAAKVIAANMHFSEAADYDEGMFYIAVSLQSYSPDSIEANAVLTAAHGGMPQEAWNDTPVEVCKGDYQHAGLKTGDILLNNDDAVAFIIKCRDESGVPLDIDPLGKGFMRDPGRYGGASRTLARRYIDGQRQHGAA